MTSFRGTLCGLFASSALAGLTVAPAYAQDQPAPADQAPAQTAADDEEEIVVTAQKRSERLEDVPISITALSETALQDAGVETLKDIESLTPGLQFQQTQGYTMPMIRGVGSSIVSPGVGTNVGIYVDGFYLPNPLTTDMQMLNVTSVQVLKGPQGTLFGRNSTGGAILVRTSDPSTEPALRAEVSYGSRQTLREQVYVTAGFGERVAFDIAAQHATGDVFKRNIFLGTKEDFQSWAVRFGLKVDFSDNFSIVARYSHADVDDPNTAQTNPYNLNGVPQSAGAAYGAPFLTVKPNEISSNLAPQFRSKSDAYQLTANLDLGFADLTSYTQYRDEQGTHVIDLDASSIPVFDIAFTYYNKIFTQELTIASKPGPRLQWTAGVFYYHDKSPAETVAGFGGAPLLPFVRNSATNVSLAGYADLTYQVSPKFFVTGGLRIARNIYKDAFYQLLQVQLPPNGGPVVPLSDIRDTSLNPRVVLRYAPDGDSSIYASFSTGYKAGTRDIAANSDALTRPEKMQAFELGYKRSVRGFTLNLAAFHYRYKDLQVANYVGGQARFNNTDARVYGIDGDVSYRVSPAFDVNAGFAYLKAEFKDWADAPDYIQCLNFLTCGLAYGTFQIFPKNVDGKVMQFSPKFTGNVGARYRVPLADGELTLSGIFTYTSKTYFDPVQTYGVGERINLDLRAAWKDSTERFTIAVFADNVTNERYLVNAIPNPTAIVALWNTPRTIGASLGMKF